MKTKQIILTVLIAVFGISLALPVGSFAWRGEDEYHGGCDSCRSHGW